MADSVGTEALFSDVSNFVMPRLLKDVRRDCAHKKTGIMSSDMMPGEREPLARIPVFAFRAKNA